MNRKNDSDCETDFSVDSLEIDNKKDNSNVNKNKTKPVTKHDCVIKSKGLKLNFTRPLGVIPNYLLNKKPNKEPKKKKGYLDMFREKFKISQPKEKIDNESIVAQDGDEENDSLDGTIDDFDFADNECYNDIFYDKIIEEFKQQQEERQCDVVGDPAIDAESCKKGSRNPSFRSRSRSVAPPLNFKLGGLGANVESLKPKMERVRSLRRYSEQIRIENKDKIYTRRSSKLQIGSPPEQSTNSTQGEDKRTQNRNFNAVFSRNQSVKTNIKIPNTVKKKLTDDKANIDTFNRMVNDKIIHDSKIKLGSKIDYNIKRPRQRNFNHSRFNEKHFDRGDYELEYETNHKHKIKFINDNKLVNSNEVSPLKSVSRYDTISDVSYTNSFATKKSDKFFDELSSVNFVRETFYKERDDFEISFLAEVNESVKRTQMNPGETDEVILGNERLKVMEEQHLKLRDRISNIK